MALFKKKKDDVPADHGAIPHNTNDALARINESNDEANNPTVQGEVERDTSLDRQEGETQQAYNERVPVAIQPVQPAPTKSYLGQDL